MSVKLEMWTVYDHPQDFPNDWVARKWLIADGSATATSTHITAATLVALRAALPPGLYRMHRYEADDPCIAEVWL